MLTNWVRWRIERTTSRGIFFMSPTQILTRRKPHISKGSSRSCCQVPDGSANVCRLHCLLCRQTDHDSFKGLIVALLYEPLFSWAVLHWNKPSRYICLSWTIITMLTIADRWRLSLPDPWLVPLHLPWDWDPCLRSCQSSSAPSPPNPSLTTWPAALPSASSPISNYKKMNQTLFWDLYISRSKCFSSWWSWPSWCLRSSLQNTRCPPSHYLLFSLSFCVFVFVFFICLCVCVCLFIYLCLCCHCCQIFSIYLVDITNEFRWTSLSFG